MTLNSLKIERGWHYLATPYSKYPGGIDEAHRISCELAGALLKIGVPVFSPIAHSHPIAVHSGIDPYSHDIWLPICEPMMASAHGILVAELPSWETSKGIDHEIRWFEAHGKPRYSLTLAHLEQLLPGRGYLASALAADRSAA